MNRINLSCVECNAQFPATLQYECTECGGILEVIHEGSRCVGDLRQELVSSDVGLDEGNTPLIAARPGSPIAGAFRGRIWLKDETRNPSGSFKDRLVSAALSQALRLGSKGLVCASSGNAGASAAAYAARAGVPAIIVVPQRTPLEKMTQITAYGAKLVKVEGHYSNSYATALRIAEETGFVNVTTTFINPYGTDALRLVGHELYEQLGKSAPDWVFIPTGSGPLVKGVVQGFGDMAGAMPKVVAVQAEGCAPIVRAFQQELEAVTAWGEPTTIASGISDPLRGYERDGTYTLNLVRKTGGRAVSVTDDEIRKAMRDLAGGGGIFAEPTGASSLAAAHKMIAAGEIGPDDSIVCMITGHGFKDFKIYRDMPVREISVASDAPVGEILQSLEMAIDRQGVE
jgi:threonine synthase